MMKVVILLFLMLGTAQADNLRNPFMSDTEIISQQGSLVKVSVARGEPIKIFVFGRKEAEIDLSTSQWDLEFNPNDLSIGVKRVGPKFSKILKVERQKNHFVIANPETDEKVYTLEVTTDVKGKKEKFKFKIDNRLK